MASAKDKLIQKAESLGIDFDSGTITVPELQAKIDTAEEAMPRLPVQPLDSQPDEDEPVTGATMRCWNCKNQGTKTKTGRTPRLNQDGVCDVCGFDVKSVYNGDIEADKAAQRVEAVRAAERK